MDSPGALKFYDEPARPRDIIAVAQENGVGVMGIRAVQAGALTDAIDRDLPPDHGEVRDFRAKILLMDMKCCEAAFHGV